MKIKISATALAVISLMSNIPLAQAAGPSKPAAKKAPAAAAKKPPQKPVRLKIEVPCRAWVPKTLPKVVVLCVHGLGLNSKSYEEFGKQMSDLGIAVFAVDVRGFGTWMQMKGKDELDFNSCLSDVYQALGVLHKAYPGLPVYLLGESMGGAIALRVASTRPDLVDGLISAVPSGDRFHKTREELGVALRIVSGRNRKAFDVGDKVIKQATDDPEVAEAWKGDPLNRLDLTPHELRQFQNFMNENHDAAKSITKLPVLVLAGFKDKLVKPEGTIELFNELESPDKLLVVVGNGEHLLFEEGHVSDQVVWVLLGWLKSHVGQRGT